MSERIGSPNVVIVATVLACATVFVPMSLLTARPRSDEIAGTLGTSKSGSGYLDLNAPINFRRGERIRLLIGGTARKIVVRLLPRNAKADSPVGVIGGPID